MSSAVLHDGPTVGVAAGIAPECLWLGHGSSPITSQSSTKELTKAITWMPMPATRIRSSAEFRRECLQARRRRPTPS